MQLVRQKNSYIHMRRLLPPGSVATLELPAGEPQAESRTQVFAALQDHCEWTKLIVTQLKSLTGCRITCTGFLSRPEEDNAPAEEFRSYASNYALILQLRGAQRWSLRKPSSNSWNTFIANSGDLIVVREETLYRTGTPPYVMGEENPVSLRLQFLIVPS